MKNTEYSKYVSRYKKPNSQRMNRYYTHGYIISSLDSFKRHTISKCLKQKLLHCIVWFIINIVIKYTIIVFRTGKESLQGSNISLEVIHYKL
jgi:hypothetical protein